MPPLVIAICGAGSGSGKTTMAEELLRRATGRGMQADEAPPKPGARLGNDREACPASVSAGHMVDASGSPPHPVNAPWGFIKFTKTGLYTSVVTGADVLLEEGKDTSRVLKAGAHRAIWVRSPGGAGLEEALSMAIGELHGCSVVVVEGNSAVELLKPDIVIFMSGLFFKSGAESALRMADIVFRPDGAVVPAAPDAIKKGAVFCGGLELSAGEVLKRVVEREGKRTV